MFAQQCERKFGGNPLAGGPKLQLFHFDICKFLVEKVPKDPYSDIKNPCHGVTGMMRFISYEVLAMHNWDILGSVGYR